MVDCALWKVVVVDSMPVSVAPVDEVVNASVVVAVAIDSETYVVDAVGCEDGFALVQPQSNNIQAKHRHSLRIFMGASSLQRIIKPIRRLNSGSVLGGH